MKLDFIKRGAETRLILIFAGWSTDSAFYRDCVLPGWDTAVVSDYRNFEFPQIPDNYSVVYLFAYSLGVWAASLCPVRAAVRVAVCGTPVPVSDRFGIPENVFLNTAAQLSVGSLAKFHLRMAGSRANFSRLQSCLPADPDIEMLREELLAIAGSGFEPDAASCRWHRAYVASADRIFPAENQLVFWHSQPATEVVSLDSPHAVDMAWIVRQCVPDHASIGNGFANALDSYRRHALVQAGICGRMGEMLNDLFGDKSPRIGSLLEIGPGAGLLTDVWSRYLSPSEATFIDLFRNRTFGCAPVENYVVADAEDWLRQTNESFDVILSASAVQWFADPVGFVALLAKHLNRGGVAVVSTFVTGNLRELDPFRTAPILYHTPEEYLEACDAAALAWTETVAFDSPRQMLMHLKLTGVRPAVHRASSQPLKLTALPSQLTYAPMILTIKA